MMHRSTKICQQNHPTVDQAGLLRVQRAPCSPEHNPQILRPTPKIMLNTLDRDLAVNSPRANPCMISLKRWLGFGGLHRLLLRTAISHHRKSMVISTARRARRRYQQERVRSEHPVHHPQSRRFVLLFVSEKLRSSLLQTFLYRKSTPHSKTSSTETSLSQDL